MKILKTVGVEDNGKIISEYDFEHYNILPTKEAIEEYFAKYGYSFVGIYDLAKNLIIVQDKNFEVSMLLGMFYKTFRVINYKTGEIVNSGVTSDSLTDDSALLLSFTHRIITNGKRSKLIRTMDSETVLEADFIKFISPNEVLFRKCNLEYIMEVDTLQVYPLVKSEYKVYQGPHPERFIDFRNGMYYQNQRCIFPVDIKDADLDYLVETFPFGEKKDRLFFLLDKAMKYGIRYDSEDTIKEIWYDTEEERDSVYEQVQASVLNIFESAQAKEKEKVNKRK